MMVALKGPNQPTLLGRHPVVKAVVVVHLEETNLFIASLLFLLPEVD